MPCNLRISFPSDCFPSPAPQEGRTRVPPPGGGDGAQANHNLPLLCPLPGMGRCPSPRQHPSLGAPRWAAEQGP